VESKNAVVFVEWWVKCGMRKVGSLWLQFRRCVAACWEQAFLSLIICNYPRSATCGTIATPMCKYSGPACVKAKQWCMIIILALLEYRPPLHV